MEQQNRPFIHDTINLDEIRMLLGDDVDTSAAAEDNVVETEHVELSVENTERETAEALLDQDADDIPVDDLNDEIELPSFVTEEQVDETMPDVSCDLESADVEESEEIDLETDSDETPEEGSDISAEEDPEEKPIKKKNSAAFELYAMLHDVIYLLAAVTLIFVFVVRLVGVKGDSMLPTLHNRDFLILESNFLYGRDDLKYGDVVVLNVASEEMKKEGPIVKRVIATEGQEVNIDFETGAVYVNGVLLHETYINTPTNYNWDGEYGLQYPAVVPENCIFVLGDNRNDSLDSRYAPIGMVDERCVLGKVLMIAMPGQTVDQAGNVIDPRDWGRIGLVS